MLWELGEVLGDQVYIEEDIVFWCLVLFSGQDESMDHEEKVYFKFLKNHYLFGHTNGQLIQVVAISSRTQERYLSCLLYPESVA